MRARAHMAQVLEGTGLYSLTGSTPVDWELDAYSAGFAPLEAAFDKLLADLFAATATRERLAQGEALFLRAEYDGAGALNEWLPELTEAALRWKEGL